MSSKQLAEELHIIAVNTIIKKFEKRKDNIWGDLADMQLISKFNKGFRFLLCVIIFCSKYSWVLSLKDKRVIAATNAFHNILNESNSKTNKIGVDKGTEFFNRSMKSCLQDNYIEMHLTHKERKSVVVERFIIVLQNKVYKCMTSVSKNVYINKSDDIANIYNNTYHSTIRMKAVDVKSTTYIDSGIENNDKDPKCKVVDHDRISKHKNIFQVGQKNCS